MGSLREFLSLIRNSATAYLKMFYQILFCFAVTFCKCVEGSCFRAAGHQSGMPTVGMAVGILLTTFLVIGEYNFSDSRIPALGL